ncbi:DUF3887 domain-containing protein [Pseudoflavonifractor sp. 60]|uniref:DUF3887 domain-containing protein n=1 Tax=Pseudoflavonifractor sp. 60 TaxID=2304576 RepID=UPI00136EBAF5|nr:DUF3887 domain-containing protein [Pseudoflavonifractor sp. 60]
MRKKLLLLSILAALCLLAGCKVSGNPLPEGMEKETLLEQGREIVTLLNEGGYQEVYDRLRADAQETSSPEGIQTYMEERLDKAQAYVRETEAIATGQKIKDTGEQYGTAVFYCKHEKKSVMYRIAYSTDLELMGIQVSVR